jgi:16S rRNA (uracil1498-N3)-methyltransferase
MLIRSLSYRNVPVVRLSTSLFSIKRQDITKYPRIFLNNGLSLNNVYVLEEEQSHYVSNVMRLKVGAKLRIFDNLSCEYIASISDINKKRSSLQVSVDIIEQIKNKTDKYAQPLPITLYCAPIKKQRMKLLLEKVTELGISTIVPVITQNTNDLSGINNAEANQKVLIESAEQSERLYIPTILPSVKFTNFLQSISSGTSPCDDVSTLLVCRERADQAVSSIYNTLQKCYNGKSKVGILIGPEGGFTQEEFEIMEKYSAMENTKVKIVFVTLGDNMLLRSETAAIVAIAHIQQYLYSLTPGTK